MQFQDGGNEVVQINQLQYWLKLLSYSLPLVGPPRINIIVVMTEWRAKFERASWHAGHMKHWNVATCGAELGRFNSCSWKEGCKQHRGFEQQITSQRAWVVNNSDCKSRVHMDARSPSYIYVGSRFSNSKTYAPWIWVQQRDMGQTTLASSHTTDNENNYSSEDFSSNTKWFRFVWRINMER